MLNCVKVQSLHKSRNVNSSTQPEFNTSEGHIQGCWNRLYLLVLFIVAYQDASQGFSTNKTTKWLILSLFCYYYFDQKLQFLAFLDKSLILPPFILMTTKQSLKFERPLCFLLKISGKFNSRLLKKIKTFLNVHYNNNESQKGFQLCHRGHSGPPSAVEQGRGAKRYVWGVESNFKIQPAVTRVKREIWG